MTSSPSHVTPLRLVQPVVIDVPRAAAMLGQKAASWLGTPVPATSPGRSRFLTDLSLPIRNHAPSLVFKKAAFVDLGGIREIDGGCELEISWQSSSLAPLFPVFSGHLTLTSTELRLEGFYAPPGGELGAVLDKAFLGIAARGTARWLLERATQAIADPDAESILPTSM
jgi:hypothetical protein